LVIQLLYNAVSTADVT